MKTKNGLNRRDFLNGCALSVAAGSAISPLEALAQGALNPYALPADYYPPTRQGLRGSHDGSFKPTLNTVSGRMRLFQQAAST
jgi:spermidine dehydrogenase